MRIRVYRYDGPITRSILYASCIAEVDTDELPDDQDGFARMYGGDFIEFDDDTQDE